MSNKDDTKPAAAKTNKRRRLMSPFSTSPGLTRAQAAAEVAAAFRLEPIEDVSNKDDTKPAVIVEEDSKNKKRKDFSTSPGSGLTRAQAAAQVVAAARLEPVEDARALKRKGNVSKKDDTKPAAAKTKKRRRLTRAQAAAQCVAAARLEPLEDESEED